MAICSPSVLALALLHHGVIFAAAFSVHFDNATLPLLTGGSKPAFVRFDQEYAYGAKNDEYNKLADAAVGEQLIIGTVHIGTYGEKMNQDLAERYGYKEKGKDLDFASMSDIFPKFRFFPANNVPDIDYTGEVTFAAIAAFLKEKTNIDITGKSGTGSKKHPSSNAAKDYNIVGLDAAGFATLIGGSLPAFVRFDKEYPYGPKATAFKELGKSLAGAKVLLGSVGVNSATVKRKPELAALFEKFGFKEKDKDLDMTPLPKFLYFPANGGQDNGVEYTEEVTLEAMREYLTKEAKIYMGRPGTLFEFDKLASAFVKAADQVGRDDALARAKLAVDAVKDKAAAAYYLRHMGFAQQKGVSWFKTEHDRIQWMLDNGKLIDFQRSELELKANRLRSFIMPYDEL